MLLYRESEEKINYFNNADTIDTSTTIQLIDGLFEYNSKAAYYVIVSQLLYTIFHRISSNRLKNKANNIEEIQVEQLIPEINPYFFIDSIIKDIDYESDAYLAEKFNEFMNKFGHLRDSGNDFSQPPWSEDPQIFKELIKQRLDTKPIEPAKKIGKKGWLLNKTQKRAYECIGY